MNNIYLYLLTGACAGALSGLFGIGGGVIVIPALAWIFAHEGFAPDNVMHMAVATSLAVMIMTTLSGVIAHHRQQTVRWDFFSGMWLLLIIGSVLGVALARFLPAATLRLFFAAFLCYVGLRLFLSKYAAQQRAVSPAACSLRFISLLTGTLAGILGISGGVVLGPFFLRHGFSVAEAAGTSIICGFLIALSATASFWLMGLHLPHGVSYLYWPAFFSVAVASVIAAPLGARLGKIVPREMSRCVFAILLFVIAGTLFF